MNTKKFENRPVILDQEFNINLEDDYDYFHTENINDENLHIGSFRNELHPRDSYQYSNICDNESCNNITTEINKLCEECLNLEHKCILMDHYQSKSLLEMTENISELNKSIISMLDIVEAHEGEALDDLDYPKLTKVEMNLLKLLTKVKTKISILEYDIINGTTSTDNYDDMICIQCRSVNINCVLRPCNHVCLCIDCVKNLLKCPMCNKFIEYFDKVYLPNN
jgi:hypothetical protein